MIKKTQVKTEASDSGRNGLFIYQGTLNSFYHWYWYTFNIMFKLDGQSPKRLDFYWKHWHFSVPSNLNHDVFYWVPGSHWTFHFSLIARTFNIMLYTNFNYNSSQYIFSIFSLGSDRFVAFFKYYFCNINGTPFKLSMFSTITALHCIVLDTPPIETDDESVNSHAHNSKQKYRYHSLVSRVIPSQANK